MQAMKIVFGSLIGVAIVGGMVAVLILGFVLLFVTGFEFGDEEMAFSNAPSQIAEEEIPEQFIPIYKEAGEEYDVPWLLLASIHRVETVFSSIEMVSPVNAQGHMQMMPCSWLGWDYPNCEGLGGTDIPEAIKTDPEKIEDYGGFGVDANGNGKASPWEEEDAIFAAANHLASYIDGNKGLREALFAYNHAHWYVEDVMHYYQLYNDGFAAKDGGIVEVYGDKAWVVPHTKNLTSGYGHRTMNGEQEFHGGIDVAGGNDRGQPIVAFKDGKVVVSQGNTGGFGNLVIIQHGDDMLTFYAHLMEQGVPVGTEVKAGQMIGKMGTSGNSTGVHLHFEVHVKKEKGGFQRVDPMPYVKAFLGS
ncbi:peptidoglycan DD-metalloendopeptidase family protein [Lentibacillus sp.]|uniref:peptidoglycan DD-metalloendopeptidase family protein n=1 Tax=Lentibacillus sp. TaxID=1925746 RepID=UPI002B4AD8B0|nr:peptidoglycan DD-metalloendopeptidase family protein [Lentibacillus sp.]HLS09832.1 peptidoglycan DD-metalloendopeptidase family protein [Lentibacillus sp.]